MQSCRQKRRMTALSACLFPHASRRESRSQKAAGGDVATTRRDALLLLKQAESLAAEYEVDVGLQASRTGCFVAETWLRMSALIPSSKFPRRSASGASRSTLERRLESSQRTSTAACCWRAPSWTPTPPRAATWQARRGDVRGAVTRGVSRASSIRIRTGPQARAPRPCRRMRVFAGGACLGT